MLEFEFCVKTITHTILVLTVTCTLTRTLPVPHPQESEEASSGPRPRLSITETFHSFTSTVCEVMEGTEQPKMSKKSSSGSIETTGHEGSLNGIANKSSHETKNDIEMAYEKEEVVGEERRASSDLGGPSESKRAAQKKEGLRRAPSDLSRSSQRRRAPEKKQNSIEVKADLVDEMKIDETTVPTIDMLQRAVQFTSNKCTSQKSCAFSRWKLCVYSRLR